MKAQVLHKYDPEMKEKVWVTGEELPNPKIEKAFSIFGFGNSSPVTHTFSFISGSYLCKTCAFISFSPYIFFLKPY